MTLRGTGDEHKWANSCGSQRQGKKGKPECTPDSGYPFFPHQRQTRLAQASLLLRDSNRDGGKGGLCVIIHRGEAGEADGRGGAKCRQSKGEPLLK